MLGLEPTATLMLCQLCCQLSPLPGPLSLWPLISYNSGGADSAGSADRLTCDQFILALPQAIRSLDP